MSLKLAVLRCRSALSWLSLYLFLLWLVQNYEAPIRSKDDILRIEQQTDRIEDMVRKSEDKIRSLIDAAEVRFENQRERVRTSQNSEMKDLENKLMDKLQRALDNPLSD